ncbi:MAG: Flp pilus assembly complex ATPase component TadA [Candidatus Omnitrophica bacterium]|nr:Flp pilus assembly complex ATPase component TadA [Candidatus Omnitrophota bacterium]
MSSLKDRIVQILLRDNIISQQNLDKALDQQKNSGEKLGKVLVSLKLVDEDALTQVLSEGLGLPPISISRLKIDPQVVKLISRESAIRYQIIPISLMGDNLTLAMADPLDIFAIDNVKALTGYAITPIISRQKEIESAIQKYYFDQSEEETTEQLNEIIKDIQEAEDVEVVNVTRAEAGKNVVEELKDEAPIIKLVDTIIHQAVTAKASDVFIEPMETTVRVRYRVDGEIREIDRMPKVLNDPMISRIKVISNLDISEHRLPQDGRFKTMLGKNREVDFRVSVLPTAMGEKIVLRVLDKQGGANLNIETLGFEPNALERLKQCAHRPHGMILTCGPTGSGKTTTLYSVLKYVDSPDKNIVTVEDPVEYQMKGLNQVNVKPHLGLTFSSSLRSILRQDPDIIMIGEIRDSETLDIAVKAALTGHLVLSSLHTTTAAGSVVRMVNMGVEPFLICSSVLAIVAQRLLRRICEDCKENYILTPEVVDKVGLGKMVPNKNLVKLYRGKGCKKCFGSGYKGRVGITEVLILSTTIKELILRNVGEVELKKAGRQEGMRTMREDSLAKALAGSTTLEEVLRITARDEE